MGSKRRECKKARKERKTEKHKGRYPSRAFATILWILVGIGCVLVFTLPLAGIEYYWVTSVRVQHYLTGMVIANIAFAPIWSGSIFYSINLGRHGIRICPSCGKRAFRGRKYCIDCGARIFWLCPKCNYRAEKKREFCENCGQSLKIVTFARQIEFEGVIKKIEPKKLHSSSIEVTGSIVRFCPACGAEISEDITHCGICGARLD